MKFLVIVHEEEGDTEIDYQQDRESTYKYWQRLVDTGHFATLTALPIKKDVK